MKRLGFSLLLSLAVFGSVAAQTGSKHVDLKRNNRWEISSSDGYRRDAIPAGWRTLHSHERR